MTDHKGDKLDDTSSSLENGFEDPPNEFTEDEIDTIRYSRRINSRESLLSQSQ